MGKLAVWCWWKLFYALTFWKKRNDLGDWLVQIERTRWPWKKFRPSVYRNEEGRSWEIWLEPDATYYSLGTIKADLGISRDTGRIVALTLWDEVLSAPARDQEGERDA